MFKLNLLNSETSADLSNYVQNGEWDLVRSKIFTINVLDVWTCNMCKRNLIQTVLLGGCRSGEKCCLLLVLWVFWPLSLFFLFYYESIYCFFLFRISCANLLQTNKNIVHCLNSTQLAGEAPYPDVTYHLTLRRRPLFYGFHFFPHSHSMGSCCPLKKRSVI